MTSCEFGTLGFILRSGDNTIWLLYSNIISINKVERNPDNGICYFSINTYSDRQCSIGFADEKSANEARNVMINRMNQFINPLSSNTVTVPTNDITNGDTKK